MKTPVKATLISIAVVIVLVIAAIIVWVLGRGARPILQMSKRTHRDI